MALFEVPLQGHPCRRFLPVCDKPYGIKMLFHDRYSLQENVADAITRARSQISEAAPRLRNTGSISWDSVTKGAPEGYRQFLATTSLVSF